MASPWIWFFRLRRHPAKLGCLTGQFSHLGFSAPNGSSRANAAFQALGKAAIIICLTGASSGPGFAQFGGLQGYPRGRWLGRLMIVSSFDPYSSTIVGSVTINGVRRG